MNILYISDNSLDLVGGTNEYVKNVLKYVSIKNKIVFVYPSNIRDKIHTINNVIFYPINIENHLTYRNKMAYYMKYFNNILEDLIKQYKIDVFHLLSGFIIINKINFSILKKYDVKTFLTIHNVPPQECSKSWLGDNIFIYCFDVIRKIILHFESIYRIRKAKYDNYIAMSEYVKKLILKCNNSINIEIIKLGSSVNYINNNNYKDYSEYKILTVAGIVPHKNQLLIAKTCRYLIKKNIKFNWLIVGPIRNARYYQKLIKVIKKYKLENVLKIITSAKVDEVKAAYRNANIYIQPSKEEGFCIAALDAIMNGIPLIGSNVGDIYNMANITNGKIIELNQESIYKAIISIKTNNNNISKEIIRNEYNWEKNISKLMELYKLSI